MRNPEDDQPTPPGGRAAERLKEFLERRLPPGASPEELNPEIAEKKQEEEKQDEVGPPGAQPGPDE